MKKQLNKKEIKELNDKIKSQFGIDEFFLKKDNVEEDNNEFIIIKRDQKPAFFAYEGALVPILSLLLEKQILPIVTIDMPAVKFVTNGADIMRPGIKSVGEFEKDALVCIVDETHKKPLAIGKALLSSKEIMQELSGKVIKNLHYVGDKIWKSIA